MQGSNYMMIRPFLVSNQLLTALGNWARFDNTLPDYNILQKGSVLHVVLRLRGGGEYSDSILPKN